MNRRITQPPEMLSQFWEAVDGVDLFGLNLLNVSNKLIEVRMVAEG